MILALVTDKARNLAFIYNEIFAVLGLWGSSEMHLGAVVECGLWSETPPSPSWLLHLLCDFGELTSPLSTSFLLPVATYVLMS